MKQRDQKNWRTTSFIDPGIASLFPAASLGDLTFPALFSIDKFHCSLEISVNSRDTPCSLRFNTQNIPCFLEINDHVPLFSKTPGRHSEITGVRWKILYFTTLPPNCRPRSCIELKTNKQNPRLLVSRSRILVSKVKLMCMCYLAVILIFKFIWHKYNKSLYETHWNRK